MEEIIIGNAIIKFILNHEDMTAKIDGIYNRFSSKSIENLVIPEEIEGSTGGFFTVDGFCCSNIFCNVKKLVIPKTIKYLREQLFYDNNSLEEIVLPKELIHIPEGCFLRCKSLKKVSIPENSSLEFIGINAFHGCSRLKDFYFPPTLKCVWWDAFRYSGLEKVVLGGGLLLKSGVFLNCKNLKYVKFIGEKIMINFLKNISDSRYIFPKNNNIEFVFDLRYLLKNYSIPEINKILKISHKSISDYLNLYKDGDSLAIGPLLDKNELNTYSGDYFIPKEVILKGSKEPVQIKRIDNFAFSGCKDLGLIEISSGIEFNENLVFFNSDYKLEIV